MEKREILDQLRTLIYATPLVVLAFWQQLGLTVKEAFYIVIGCAVAITLFRISGTLEKGITVKVSSSSNPNSNEEEEEEIRTSGAGAFAGMICGGAIGLTGGPVGVLIGGILGAFLGNYIEYEQEKARRSRYPYGRRDR